MSGDGHFGTWIRDEWGLPAYRYGCDFRTDPAARYDTLTHGASRLHWHAAGNDRLWFQATNEGWIRLYEASRGRRWWHDRAACADVDGVSTADGARPTWGVGYARYETVLGNVSIDRLVVAPFGDHPFLVCRIVVRARNGDACSLKWTERWPLRPIWLSGLASPDERREAAGTLRHRRISTERLTHITESWGEGAATLADDGEWPLVPAPGAQTWLAWLGGREHLHELAWTAGDRALSSQFHLDLPAGRELTLWLVTGIGTVPNVDDFDGEEIVEHHFAAWRDELCGAEIESVPDLRREVAWSAAATRSAALADDVVGHTFIDQGGCYADPVGASNCRDTVQHALPLVYTAPHLAAESLCHCLATSDESGTIEYAYLGAGLRHRLLWDPSDLDLWVLWLATEYVAATGDTGILDHEVGCWPQQAALDMWPGRFGGIKPGPILPVREHLRIRLDHLIDSVGVGAHGLIRIRNADWNDSITFDSPDPAQMGEAGESVLNSAMARWILPRYAALCRRDGDAAAGRRAEELSDALAAPLSAAWAGTHYVRAYCPGTEPIGADVVHLEPQPWTILSGDAGEQAGRILDTIDARLRRDSPLGARLHSDAGSTAWGRAGEATSGGIWPAVNHVLVWAAARRRPDLARDELTRMLLATHAKTYPDLWFGIWGGSDAWNAPESDRPGETWFEEGSQLSAQATPVGNTHVHSDVVHAVLRVFGVEVGPDGILCIDPTPVAAGGRLRLPRLNLDVSDSGRVEGQIRVDGPVEIDIRGRRTQCERGWNVL